MSRISRAFTEHPASVGETYGEHLRSALGFSASMCRAALCCGVHAFLPFLFQRTGSQAIDDLYTRMVRQRAKLGVAQSARDAERRSSERPRPHVAV